MKKLIVKKAVWVVGWLFFWKEGVDVRVIKSSDNHILAKVVEEDGSEWFLTAFYG